MFLPLGGAPTPPGLFLFLPTTIIPHFPAFVNICNRFSRNFFSVSSIFSPPAQGGARKRTDARTKAAHGRAEGRGGPGRENGAVGGTRAGRARRTSRRQNRASHQQTGWGAGGANPHKTRARTHRSCRCFYSIKRARARRTKASHETRAQTGTNGKTRDAAGPGTIGNRAAPANPPRGAPAWEVGPQTERRLRSADAREPELHNTRPWGGGLLLSGRGPTDPPLSRSRQRHPRARHQLTGGAGAPLVQAPPLRPSRTCKNLRFLAVFCRISADFLQLFCKRFTKILHFLSPGSAFLNPRRAQGRMLKRARKKAADSQ